jgi:hypothetical protein
MAENDSRSRQDFLRPRVWSKVLIALVVPTIVFASLGGTLGALSLYLIIVVDGFVLGSLALSRFDPGLGRMMIERNNDDSSIHDYGLLAGGRVLSLAIEVNLAARRSKYFSTSARKNLATVLSGILPPASSRAAFPGTGGTTGIRGAELEPQAASDLRVLLSYNQQNQPSGGGAKQPSPKVGGGSLPVLGRVSRRLSGKRDLDYLARLERVVAMLEKEEEDPKMMKMMKMMTPAPESTQHPVGDPSSS